MSLRILVLLLGISMSSILLAQGVSKDKTPIKYRLLMTTVNVEDVNKDEIAITLNAFNTGRNPIDFSSFNGVPPEMEIKFEESFYRSNLSALEEDIVSSLINRNININNGKIVRNLRFNLPCTEDLYKQLTKKEKRYTRNYSPKSKSNSPELKYKTSKKRETMLAKLAKKKKTQDKESIAVQDADVNPTKIKEKKTPKIKENKSKPSTKIKTEKLVDTDKQSTKIDVNPSDLTPAAEKQKADVAIEEKKSSLFSKQKERKKELEEIKKDSYKIDQASQKEDEKAILESLGVKETKPKKEKSKKEDAKSDVTFDTKAGVEASKNSYAEKSVCPDMVLDNITIIKKSKNWITLEYTLTNIGKGPAYLGENSNNQGLALRAFLSSSDKITRGSLPLGGGFVSYNNKDSEELEPQVSFTSTLKLDIRKMTKFTPYIILNLDPFNALEECTKANNYGQVKVGG